MIDHTENVPAAEGVEGVPMLAIAAAAVSVIGLADSVYLTIKHLTAEPVPCSILEGCEQVLTSPYAEIGGVPLAAIGAASYFAAFALTVLAVFGNRSMWTLFCVLSAVMAAVSLYLVYLQGAVIGAFCQFCLVSAATSILLFLLAAVSRFTGRR